MMDPSPNDFTPPELEEISALFPSYEILSFIAKGGMGAVYLARQKSLEREVAIKILPRLFGEDADFRSSSESEAKSMAKLNHPNLVGIYDFGQVDGMLYIIMEMVHGTSLYHSAYGKTIDPAEAGRIVCEICHGLANAHKHGILHRDIKPANILLDHNGSPKISDFGLARPVGDHEADSAFGTPGYTAPEVVHNPSAVDESTDLYSVGVILYELLTSKLPDQLYMPAANLVHCDPRFDDIVRKAMNPNPVPRYRSAESLADAIEEITHDKKKPSAENRLITAASSPGPGQAASRGRTPSPVIKTSSSGPFVRNIIIIIVLLGAVYAAWEHYKTKKAEREVENALIVKQNEEKKAEAKKQQLLLRKKKKAASASSKSLKPPPIQSPQEIKPRNRPPAPVIDVRCRELEDIRTKCFELTTDIKQKHEKKFIENTDSFKRELDKLIQQRRVSSELVPTVQKMRNGCIDNRITNNVTRQDIASNTSVTIVYDDRLKRQDKIEKEFLKAIEKLRGYYRKNLNTIKEEMGSKGLDAQYQLLQREIEATDDPGEVFVDYILNGN